MNVNFEMGIQHINLGNYDNAVKSIKAAIDEELENNDEKTAIEYTCVLGELLADLGKKKEAEAEFNKVIEYCDRTNDLPKQRKIAQEFLDLISGRTKLVIEGETPRNVKPVQDKAFITKQQRRRRK